jgi:FAD/FMN-containing dehydrogenase
MRLIRSGDAGYDEARTIFNAMVDKRPAVIAQCTTPADVVEALEPAETEGWAKAFRDDIAKYASGGVYLNFVGDEGEDRVRAAFGDDKYARLARIKGEWDPGNVFRGNQNIRPG